MPIVSHDIRRHVGSGAATLWERLAGLPYGAHTASKAEPETLAAWIQAFSSADVSAFERRLAWDGLDRDTVLAALAAPAELEPVWTGWLQSFLEESAAFAQDLRRSPSFEESRYFPPAEAPPFLEILAPLLRAARRTLLERNRDALMTVSTPACVSLERQLLRELSLFSELALHEKFSELRQTRFPEPDQADPARAYRTFVLEILDRGSPALFDEYPVLARQLAMLCQEWRGAVGELVDRIRSDRALLTQVFGGGKDIGRLEEVETGIADRHDGGRRVVVLGFASGVRLVYKPRDVAIEREYNELLVWLERKGLPCTPPSLTVLPREGYGWVEYARDGEWNDRAAVREYYRKSGALVCLAFVLRGRDFHMENVVASRSGPILVDTEMLMQPMTTNRTTADDDLEDSCLGTGLLTHLEVDAERVVFDVGGLRGRGGGEAPVARRVWKCLGTDLLHFERDARFFPRTRNQVVLGGRAQRPDSFAEDVLSGFMDCYRFLLENRAAILAPDGPLSGFARARARILLRPSTQYGALLHVLAAPRYQRSGVSRSFALDALNRNFAADEERPLLWPLVSDERQALESLDIPRFTIGATEAALTTRTGERVEGHFSCSGLAAVRERLSTLSEENLAREHDLLKEALSSSVDSRFREELSPGTEDMPSFIDYALWIGREILDRATRDADGGLHWSWAPYLPLQAFQGDGASGLERHALYHGASGPAVFFAALGNVTADSDFKAAARAAFRPIRAFIESRRSGSRSEIGAATGLGSLVYAATLAGRFLDDPNLIEVALLAAQRIDDDAIRSDRTLDVTSGAAGAILALLALNRVAAEPRLFEQARRCGDHLLSERVEPAPGQAAWRAANGELLAGLAHGAGGIAYALFRLFEATGDGAFRDAALAGIRYERSLFSQRDRNWPIMRRGRASRGGLMTAWCHGAPGIGLARALALNVFSDESVSEEIEIAMATTQAHAVDPSDHLCCGNLGRAEALLTVGRAIEREAFVQSAGALAERVAARARVRGHFGLPGTAFEYRVFVPGFFKGLAGTGYQFLRFEAPSLLPSILGLEAPR